MTDLSTLLAELDAAYTRGSYVGLHTAWPVIRDAITQLQRRAEMAEAQRQVFEDQLNAKLTYIRERDALLAQRTEALRELVGIIDGYRNGETQIDSFTTQPARAALATEDDR